MPALLQTGQLVARKKAVPTVQVRVSQDVAELAAIVAAYQRKQVSDTLSEILRPILQQMHAAEVARASAYPLSGPGPGSEPPAPPARPKRGKP